MALLRPLLALSLLLVPQSLWPQDLPLIPYPARLERRAGTLSLQEPVTVACASRSMALKEASAQLCAAVSSEGGVTARLGQRPAQATLVLALDPRMHGAESYELRITPRQARLTAASSAGLFYGVQTLRQLLFQGRESRTLPCLQISDEPVFPWRGMHLDVSRHFFPVPFIKHYLDALAAHKLNVFHWHLTDDHGWRLEIKRYPRLTLVGAWREPKDGNDWLYDPNRSLDPAKRTYGGFYTQEDVREVVRYAAARHIRVIPEIEMPAHSMAAMEAYPQLSCTGKPFVAPKVVNESTEFTDPYCAGDEAVFAFLEGVLTEVMDLFPDRDIHLGADEARKTTWKACPKCQARMRSLGLKDEEALQGWFMQRMTGFLARHGRRAIGWDEMAQGGLPEGALMMHWRSWLGDAGVVQAVRTGHEVVRTSIGELYFRPVEARGPADVTGTGLPEYLQKVLRYQPVPAGLTPAEKSRILGLEGCIWTEDVATGTQVMKALLPALAPLAEVAWSGAKPADPVGFAARLSPHLRYLDACGFEHAALPAAPGH
jgi:hexosaminidase